MQIADKKACRRYVGLLFKDVEVGESPLWLKTKLFVSGLRPINNIVDITNYLMLRTGQPLHAFDADTLSGGVHIRMAKKGERLELLTGEKKSLSADDLVIADAKHPLALAGIMGGKHSGVTVETKDIFLEIANFDGATLRRTRIRHGLATDASYRFERNLDPNLPIEVAREAAALLRELLAEPVQEPLFWVRLRSDGGYEGPIAHSAIEEVRRQSGAWTPLYAAPQRQPLTDDFVFKVVRSVQPNLAETCRAWKYEFAQCKYWLDAAHGIGEPT